MLAFRVVEHFDVVEFVPPSVVPGRIGSASNPLSFQELEEAFGHGIVVAVAASAHAGFEVVLMKEHWAFAAGELSVLVRMHCDFAVWLASPDGHQQGL